MEIDNIRNSIKKYYPVTDKSIDLLSKHFKAHNFPAKHLIIRGGVIDRNVYFTLIPQHYYKIFFLST